MKILAFDTETHRFRPGNMAPCVVCLSWSLGNHGRGLIVEQKQIENWLRQYLQEAIDGSTLLVGQYVAYDFKCILRTFPDLWDLVWKAYQSNAITCTSIREKLIDIAVGDLPYYYDKTGKKRKMETYSLEEIAAKRLGKKVDKGSDTWRLRFEELDGVPFEDWPIDARKYALDDADLTREIYVDQNRRAHGINYSLPTEFEDTRADFALALMSTWGVRVDVPRVKKLWSSTVDRMTELAAEIDKSGLATWKPQNELMLGDSRPKEVPDVKKSMKVLREAIRKHYPGEPPTTPTGKIKTGQEVVDKCDFEPLTKLVEFDKLRKIANTYLRKMFEPVVHARFDSIGGVSNRTSCSSPNLQNQPNLKGLRECFVPRDGFVFLACDFDSQEMRTLAQSCLDIVGRSKLAERYQRDRHFDPHLEFAARLARISIEEAVEKLQAEDPFILKLRQKAKICNFGFPGGMAPKTLVDYAKGWGVRIDATQAKEFQDIWFEQWPEMDGYFEHVRALIGHASNGTATHPQSGFRRGALGYCDASNGYFQTLAAHASKAALFEVCRRAYNDRESVLFGLRAVLFVHDEVILETPESGSHEAASELERVLVESMEKWTPDIPAAASATLMNVWSKQAKRVVEDGRLVTWKE